MLWQIETRWNEALQKLHEEQEAAAQQHAKEAIAVHVSTSQSTPSAHVARILGRSDLNAQLIAWIGHYARKGQLTTPRWLRDEQGKQLLCKYEFQRMHDDEVVREILAFFRWKGGAYDRRDIYKVHHHHVCIL